MDQFIHQSIHVPGPPRICTRKLQHKKMTGKYSILASAVYSSLPLSLPAFAAASPGIFAQWQQQRSISFHPPISSPSPYRERCPNPDELRVEKFGAPPPLGFSCGRVEKQFPSIGDVGRSVFLTRRAASSSRTGAEAEEFGKTSTIPGGSDGYLPGGRYCVLLTGHASDYAQKLYGGYGQMFIKLLGDPHEKWDVYAVVDGQFPPEEELEKYDGFVITGSRHDAHGTEEWITKLCSLLQSLHEKKVNTLGICFGHQVLSRALGGKTGKADVGWEIGLRQIQTTTALAAKPYALGVPPVFRVLTVHQDQVKKIPPGGEVLGFSERTGIEMFAVGDHALGIQGHPEFTEDVVTDLIDTRLSSGILTEEEAKVARATLRAGQADREALLRLCKGFLKRRKS